VNVTQAVIDAAGGSIRICGLDLAGTACGANDSVLEALCSKLSGDQRVRLATQLAAVALNCTATNGNPDCSGVSIAPVFQACNAFCIEGTPEEQGACVTQLGCWNDGGLYDATTDMCATGTCSDNGQPCADDALGLCDSRKADCVPSPGNCHDAPLVNSSLGLSFQKPGACGSKSACDAAKSGDCTIFSAACSSSGCP
jgi:hypothetical protein